jgi:hypothetical protein
MLTLTFHSLSFRVVILIHCFFCFVLLTIRPVSLNETLIFHNHFKSSSMTSGLALHNRLQTDRMARNREGDSTLQIDFDLNVLFHKLKPN